MSLEPDDNLVLSYDEDYMDEPRAVQLPSAGGEPEVVKGDDLKPEEPLGQDKPSEKTKAYKPAAPVGSLFGRLAKVGLGAALCFAYSQGVLCGALHFLSVHGSVSSTPLHLQWMT